MKSPSQLISLNTIAMKCGVIVEVGIYKVKHCNSIYHTVNDFDKRNHDDDWPEGTKEIYSHGN